MNLLFWKKRKILAKSVIFEITPRCNNNCIYCYNVWKHDKNYPSDELKTDTTKKLLAKVIKETGCYNISFTGGEPLLRPDLAELVQFVKEKGVSVNIITNATLMSESVTKELIESGVSLFEVPLLSSTKEIHNKLTRAESFDNVLEAIANIKYFHGRVCAVFVATKLNIKDLHETLLLAFALGAESFMLNRFNPGGEGAKHIDELLPSLQDMKQCLDVAEEFSKQYNFFIHTPIPIQPCIFDTSKYTKIKVPFCAAGTDNNYFTVDFAGNIRMCNHTSLIIGNILKESFKKIVSSERTDEFVSSVPDYCIKCDLKKTCQGGCKASAHICYGSLKELDPFLKMNVSRETKLIHSDFHSK